MNNIQETLLFPVRDADSRKQFLIACAIMLAAFIIPILPVFLLMGYSAKIMRQVTEDRKSPSMPVWQGSDWSEMFMDGLRMYAAQLVLMFPLLILMGCGMVFMISGAIGFSAQAGKNADSFAPVGMALFMIGSLFFGLFGALSLPYGVIVSAALPHVAIKRSFLAAFEFKEWFSIFRRALGQFILGYVFVTAASFVFAIIIQIAIMTLILICIVPLLMTPYITYQVLLMNTVFAQAYAIGREQLPTT